MMALGMGGMLGGQLVGYVNYHFGGGRGVTITNLVMTIIAYLVIIIFNAIYEFNFLMYMAAFLIGFINTCNITQANLILGFEFKTNIEPFAVYRLVSSLAVSLLTLI